MELLGNYLFFQNPTIGDIYALRRDDGETGRAVMFEPMCAVQRYMEERETVLQAKFLQIPD